MANNKTMKEEEIETLTRRVQKLRIELSEAEAELARKNEQMANKRTMRTNANTKLSTNGVMAHKEKINIHTKAEGKADVVMVPGDHVIKAQLAWKKEQMANKGKMRTNANTKLSTNGVTMANKEKININTEAEGKADVVMVPGDRVMITWADTGSGIVQHGACPKPLMKVLKERLFAHPSALFG